MPALSVDDCLEARGLARRDLCHENACVMRFYLRQWSGLLSGRIPADRNSPLTQGGRGLPPLVSQILRAYSCIDSCRSHKLHTQSSRSI